MRISIQKHGLTFSKLFARICEMKKAKINKKDVSKIRVKKTRHTNANKRINQREPNPWKEIRLKLQPLSKAYRSFMEQRKIAKERKTI